MTTRSLFGRSFVVLALVYGTLQYAPLAAFANEGVDLAVDATVFIVHPRRGPH